MHKFTLHGKWLEDQQQFMIWATNDEQYVLPVNDWRTLVFTWHESSYYGTFLETEQEGVRLSPWPALEFFATLSFNSFAQITTDENMEALHQLASPLFERVRACNFMPDFESWSHGQFQFRPTDSALTDDFSKKWFSLAILDCIGRDPSLEQAWLDVKKAFPLIEPMEQAFIFHEQEWLEQIGWKKSDVPFQISLRLLEPEVDGETWLLETLLHDEESHWVAWENAPKVWRAYREFIEREHEKWMSLVPWLKGKHGFKTQLTEKEAWIFLTEASEILLKAGTNILLPSWWQALKDAKLTVKAKMKSTSSNRSFVGINTIVDFDWRFSTNGIDLPEQEFRQLVEQKRYLVQIRGKWVKLDPEWMKHVQSLVKKADRQGLHLRDVLEQELLAQELATPELDEEEAALFQRIKIEGNNTVKQMVKQLLNVDSIPTLPISSRFQGTLRPYQQQGMDWLVFLRQYGLGACLGDDMGLGKTIQYIAYLTYLQEHGQEDTPHLLICPTSLLGNWQKELNKFAPSINVHLHYGSNRKRGEEFAPSIQGADIILTTYGLSTMDQEDLSQIQWSSICLDEAQNIKNAHTKQSRAVRHLNGKHKIALTGTPMENRLSELWSIYDFINPGYLGSLHQFQQRFGLPIEKDGDTKKIAQLQQLIRPFFLRRTKKDEAVALNLPDKQEQKEYCPLTVEQASLYEQLVQDTFAEIETRTGFERRGLIIQLLGKLKQLCNHPALYLKEEHPHRLVERSNKLEKLTDMVAQIREQDESCLIFTQYIQMGNMMQDVLSKRLKQPVLFLHGGCSKQERDRMIDSFQGGETGIFILSLKAGGTGLNLTAANHVIHFDRWWNPAVENQATDRAYRIGQKRFVHVHKLITIGTLEEKIDEMLEKKQSLNDQIIQSEQWITELENDELRELLRI